MYGLKVKSEGEGCKVDWRESQQASDVGVSQRVLG